MGRFKKMIVMWLLAACLCGSMLTAGCNTLKGAGKDVEQAGAGLQRAMD